MPTMTLTEPGMSQKAKLRGWMPGGDPHAGKPHEPAPHEIDLPYPAIEELPEFVTRIESADLSHGVRHYNGSIVRHGGRIFMAYRVESYRGVSSVGICELNGHFSVIRDALLSPKMEQPSNIEDPHMGSVGGKLYVFLSHVERRMAFGDPIICRQRLFELDPETLGIAAEIPHTFGNVKGVEKNWTPFELPCGSLGFVYKQDATRSTVRVHDAKGWTCVGASMKPSGDSCSISSRTQPLRISKSMYLQFVGGHVRLSGRNNRGTRYWVGAVAFSSAEPFWTLGWTTEPLVWGSEASPTIHNPLPGGGHPICILPAGAMLDGHNVFISCGVNDSYNVILRYDIQALLGKMTGDVLAKWKGDFE